MTCAQKLEAEQAWIEVIEQSEANEQAVMEARDGNTEQINSAQKTVDGAGADVLRAAERTRKGVC